MPQLLCTISTRFITECTLGRQFPIRRFTSNIRVPLALELFPTARDKNTPLPSLLPSTRIHKYSRRHSAPTAINKKTFLRFYLVLSRVSFYVQQYDILFSFLQHVSRRKIAGLCRRSRVPNSHWLGRTVLRLRWHAAPATSHANIHIRNTFTILLIPPSHLKLQNMPRFVFAVRVQLVVHGA